MICLPNWTSTNVTARVLNAIVIFVFSACLGLIGILNYLIYNFYVKSNESMPDFKNDEVTNAKQKDLFCKLLAITSVFVVLSTPMLLGVLYEFISSKQTPFW